MRDDGFFGENINVTEQDNKKKIMHEKREAKWQRFRRRFWK